MSYFNQCLPKVVSIRDGSGCAITRATLQAMTPDEFAALGDQEDLQRVYATATEAKMRGVHQRFIDQLLMGRLKYYGDKVNRTNVAGQVQSIIQPFITMRQKSVVNAGYFEIESGADVNGYRRTITVKNNSLFSQQSLVSLERYFVAGNTVIVQHVGASGAAYSAHFKIISAVNADAGGVSKATVTIEPSTVLSATFAGYTAAQKLPFQPTGGLVLLGTNSISDYESWCNYGAVDNTNSLLHFWFQTSRMGHTFTKEYLRALKAPNANEFFKVFNTLPVKEQLVQQSARFNREWWTSVFWGQPDEGQDPNSWQTSGKLEEVKDIVDGTCTLEYKARAQGIENLLGTCGRVIDYAGAPLNLDTLGEQLYQLKRHRESTSDTGEIVDEVVLQVDRQTAANIKQVFAAWYKAKYGIQYTQEIGKGPNETFAQSSGLTVNSYDFDDFAVRLTVISDPTLYDMLAATPTAHKGASRYALAIDYSDIDIGIIKSRAKENQYPAPNDVPSEFKCVIERNERNYKLYSQTWTVIAPRTERHLILKNFANACPVLTSGTCTAYAG